MLKLQVSRIQKIQKLSVLTFLNIGIVKDYFVVNKRGSEMYWCSSSTWVFSELPKLSENSEDIEKLKSLNNMFTGEFDSVLFQGSGKP